MTEDFEFWPGLPDADMEFSRVFTLRERKIIDIEIFWDHAKALDAVGLRE